MQQQTNAAATQAQRFATEPRKLTHADLTAEDLAGLDPLPAAPEGPKDLGGFIHGMLQEHFGKHAVAIAKAQEKPKGILATVGRALSDTYDATSNLVVGASTTAYHTGHDALSWTGLIDPRTPESHPEVMYPGFEKHTERRRELDTRLVKRQLAHDLQVIEDQRAGLPKRPAEDVQAAPKAVEQLAEILHDDAKVVSQEDQNRLEVFGLELMAMSANEARRLIREEKLTLEQAQVKAKSTMIPLLAAKLVEEGLELHADEFYGNDQNAKTLFLVEVHKAVAARAEQQASTPAPAPTPDVSAEQQTQHPVIDAGPLVTEPVMDAPPAPVTAVRHVTEVTAPSSTTSTPYGRFMRIFNSIEKQLPYNDAWANEKGTGYFDPAVQNAMLKAMLQPGDMARTVDPTNRAVIFIGTRHGIAVVFTRYPMGADNEAIARNVSADLRQAARLTDAAMNGSMDHPGLDEFFGDDDTLNVGNREMSQSRKRGQQARRS